jgi:hypothetical protein
MQTNLFQFLVVSVWFLSLFMAYCCSVCSFCLFFVYERMINFVNFVAAYIRAAAALCIITLLTDVVATLFTGLGLRSKDHRTKYKYYRVAVYIMVLSRMFILVSAHKISSMILWLMIVKKHCSQSSNHKCVWMGWSTRGSSWLKQ